MNKLILLIGLTVLWVSCHTNREKQIKIIPKPLKVVDISSAFVLNKNTNIVFNTDNEELLNCSVYFQKELSKIAGSIIPMAEAINYENQIIIEHKPELKSDAYNLEITNNNISIYSSSYGGVVYALQSLKQLIATNNEENTTRITIPGLLIEDEPAFVWRGFMLDVVRHMQTVDQLKQVLDYMVELKLNVFHMHLSDDQGFRMEIESYPKLNEIGSWRVDYNTTDENVNSYWGRPEQKKGDKATYGGYYTKSELKELIAYAHERNIQILPEIDVPGHSRAIIASYPELSCSKNKTYVATGWSRLNNTLCPSNEATYQMMSSVIKEVAELFPMEYIHIGGDECYRHYWEKHDQCNDFMKSNSLKDTRELQSYFIHKMEELVRANGKKMMGWDEVLDGGLAPNTTVMSWRGEKGGIKAAQMNHDVVMCPFKYHYLDFKQGQSSYEPNLGYGQSLLSDVYAYSVIPNELSKEQGKYIIGTQANLWTESVSDWGKLTYMAFPRLFAAAENAWTQQRNKNWDDFVDRLIPHMELMDKKGIRHAKSVFNPWVHHKGNGKRIEVWFTSEISDPVIRYTLDGSEPNMQSPMYTDTIEINKTATLKAAIFDKDKRMGDVLNQVFQIHQAAGAEVRLIEGETNNNLQSLTDLSYGEFLQSGDTSWVAFHGDCLIEVKLPEPKNINTITLRSLRHTLHGLYAIARFEVFADINGEYIKIGDTGDIAENYTQGRNIKTNSLACQAKNIQNIRIKIYKVDPIPETHAGAGKVSHMKIDELQIF
ncbi:beta-N-acetylhexosaminidase [Saccharicrinis sp. GN24d3]|uniref:beta-N-acetylhexosaminidase n=1 Tax=Saccharicrinis sp. GN24d3 TaxID=3458416 RepID=UPI004037000F